MDYSHMTAAELRVIAKEKGLKKVSSMKKQEILDALTELEKELNNVVSDDTAEPVDKADFEAGSEDKGKAFSDIENGDIISVVNEAETELKTEGGASSSVTSDGDLSGEEAQGDNDAEASGSENQGDEAGASLDSATENGSGEDAAKQALQRRPSSGQPVFSKGDVKEGILEIMPDGYAFIRSENFLPGERDVYVSPMQIKKLGLRTGDIILGVTKDRMPGDKFNAMLYAKMINGQGPFASPNRPKFEQLTPIFPHERLRLETPGCKPSMRIMDILSPIGKGQRGMIVSQPKAGKTTLLKQIANAIITNNPEMHMIILLIDERPEEVTDMKESIQGENVEVIYSTFDELPENHKRVSEMVIERAKRLVELKQDVVILLDSITRLARAYNLTCVASGRTLSGGLDPAALHMPKKFFGAARCMREGGSLTILATALVETGSRMDDVVFEEFKGTGNMELVLDRNLSEKRIFPAIDLPKSSTRRDDLLLTPEESEVNETLRRAFNSGRPENAVEKIINLFSRTRNNKEFCEIVKKTKLV